MYDDGVGDDLWDPPTLDNDRDDAVIEEPDTFRAALTAAIRTGRERSGWTIDRLAAEVELDRKTVSRVCNGKRWHLATVERILRALGLEAAVVHALQAHE